MPMQPALHSFAYALDYLRELVADVSPADMVAQPSGVPDHAAWTIGHLTHTCELLGVAPWLPPDYAARYGAGSVPVADVSQYVMKETALAILSDAQSCLSAAVDVQTDTVYRDVFPTVRHALVQGDGRAHRLSRRSVGRMAQSTRPATLGTCDCPDAKSSAFHLLSGRTLIRIPTDVVYDAVRHRFARRTHAAYSNETQNPQSHDDALSARLEGSVSFGRSTA